MGEDLELRRLQLQKLRRLAAIAAEKEKQKEPGTLTPLERVRPLLINRADEVLNAAMEQYPAQTEVIVKKLAELVESGKLQGNIDGGELYNLFRSLNMRVKLDTKVLYVKHGEAKKLGDLLRQG